MNAEVRNLHGSVRSYCTLTSTFVDSFRRVFRSHVYGAVKCSGTTFSVNCMTFETFDHTSFHRLIALLLRPRLRINIAYDALRLFRVDYKWSYIIFYLSTINTYSLHTAPLYTSVHTLFKYLKVSSIAQHHFTPLLNFYLTARIFSSPFLIIGNSTSTICNSCRNNCMPAL